MRFAILGDAFHFAFDFGGFAFAAFKNGVGEDVVVGNAAMAIGEAHPGVVEDVNLAAPVDRARLRHNVLRLAAMRASVHAPTPPPEPA